MDKMLDFIDEKSSCLKHVVSGHVVFNVASHTHGLVENYIDLDDSFLESGSI